MTTANVCQLECLESFSQVIPPVAVGVLRFAHSLKRNGISTTARMCTAFMGRRLRRSLRINDHATATIPSPIVRERLDLQPGEWVKVRPEAEIRATLDATARCRGLLFMPGMERHCGQRLQVMKRLEQMILESTMEIRKVRQTVLLKGAMCDGVGVRCDRSCYYFWREDWLTRIEQGGSR